MLKHGTWQSKLWYTVQALMKRVPGVYSDDGLITFHYHGWREQHEFRGAYDAARGACYSGVDQHKDWRTHVMLWAADNALKHQACIVECGTNRGWFMRAVAELHPKAPITCFDTFHGFDPRFPQDNPNVPKYPECYESTKAVFAKFPNVRLVRGTVPDSLIPISRIGLLHVDMNVAAPEMAAVRYYWPSIIQGGLVISDDCGDIGFEKQCHAWHQLAWELNRELLILPTGQGMLIK